MLRKFVKIQLYAETWMIGDRDVSIDNLDWILDQCFFPRIVEFGIFREVIYFWAFVDVLLQTGLESVPAPYLLIQATPDILR